MEKRFFASCDSTLVRHTAALKTFLADAVSNVTAFVYRDTLITGFCQITHPLWLVVKCQELCRFHQDELKCALLETRVPEGGQRFHSEQFASEKPFFEERVCQGFSVRLKLY